MRKELNKLIRDRIPEYIQREGREFALKTLTEEDYRQALLNKLVEEAREVADASPEDVVKELADLYEVVDAILASHGITREAVLEEQARRRAERGGFDRRICLLWTQ